MVGWQPPHPVPAAQWRPTSWRQLAPLRTAARTSRSEIPLQWQTITAGSNPGSGREESYAVRK